ncbi:MAG TPA: SNF2-related protein, partial [Verrucomicrobiae bacterium]|nr:SNF2-related protein [Verrucomicrobiae bacterium]
MKLQKALLDGIQRFFNSAPAAAIKRGRAYHAGGNVTELECIEPNHLYSAVVQGGEDYEVGLEFTESGWAGECSCPLSFDCKHIVAAMLALRDRAQSNGASQSVKSPGQKGQKVKATPDPRPSSPLEAKLVEHLGRKLLPNEAGYLHQVQAFYSNAKFRRVSEPELLQLADRSLSYGSYGWKELELWPDFPRDEFLCWLYVAWELRRRNIPLLAFMEGITDFSAIEKEMGDWARRKEIAHWKDWFRDFDEKAPVSDPGLLELRLVVAPGEARLQWRTAPAAQFAELKQTQAKKLAEQVDQGALAIAPDSLPLWSATYKPWHYESWWSFKYSNATARPALNRLLRMPLSPDRVVAADGQPLARAAEPLRLELRPPNNGEGNYELELTGKDGSAPPPIFCILSGRPTLYLTERCLFHGPPADALDTALRKAIPSAALETTDGLRFLHATGVLLPEHLQQRIRTEPVNVTIKCQLKTTYPGSTSEEVAISVTAKAPGMAKEKFTPQGWQDESNFESPKKVEPENGGIVLHDRAAQRHFPRVLEPLGLKWEGYPGDWKLRLTKKTPELLVPWLKSLPPEIELLLDKELATLRDEPVSGSVSLDLAEAGIDWFDLKVVLNAGDTTLTPEELKLLLNARGGYVRLGKKGWRRLQFNLTPEEDEQLARLGLNSADFTAEPQRFHALQLADEAAKKFLGPDRVEKIQLRASELKTRVSPPLPLSIRAEMRPYQTEGFHFLAYLTSNHFGGVLADDMGLGKTLQTLAWLAWIRETVRAQATAPRTSLVVCPKSVMDNWQTEAGRFYPDLRVRLWRGEPAGELTHACEAADLIVINYAQLRSLWPPIASMPWFATILDEAQYIKNPDSQTSQAARALNAEHRLALTGTPIENRLLDLWSIFGFAMPEVLGNRAHFLRRFDAKDDPLARRRLAARVRPFLLRRTKGQVAKDLPDRIEEDLLCEMEGEQQTLYRAELKRARQMLLGLKSVQ